MRLLAEVEKYTNRKEFISSSKGNDNKQNNDQLLYLHNHGQKSALNKKEYPKPKLKELSQEYLWVDNMLI